MSPYCGVVTTWLQTLYNPTSTSNVGRSLPVLWRPFFCGRVEWRDLSGTRQWQQRQIKYFGISCVLCGCLVLEISTHDNVILARIHHLLSIKIYRCVLFPFPTSFYEFLSFCFLILPFFLITSVFTRLFHFITFYLIYEKAPHFFPFSCMVVLTGFSFYKGYLRSIASNSCCNQYDVYNGFVLF